MSQIFIIGSPVAEPDAALPLPVVLDDGSVYIVTIPRMSASAFSFFLELLELYKSAIVLAPDKQPTEDSP